MRFDYWSMDGSSAPRFKFSGWAVLGSLALFGQSQSEAFASLFGSLTSVCFGAANYNISRTEMVAAAQMEIEQLTSGLFIDEAVEENDVLEELEHWEEDDGR